LYVDPLVRRLAQEQTPLPQFNSTTPSGTAWVDDLAALVDPTDVSSVIVVVLTFCFHFGIKLNERKTVLLCIRGATTFTPPPVVITIGNVTWHFSYTLPSCPVKYLGVYISGNVEQVFSFVMDELKHRIHSLHTLSLNASTRALVTNTSLLPFLSYRLTLWANSPKIPTIQAELLDYVCNGGPDTVSKSDRHIHTSRKSGGMGVRRLATALQSQLLKLMLQVLTHNPPQPQPPHVFSQPLDRTKQITHLLVRQHRQGITGHRAFNYINNYIRLLTDLKIQSPITGNQPLTLFFSAQPTADPWILDNLGQLQHHPHLQPADLTITHPHAQRAINTINSWGGTVVYTDGSATAGQAGAGYYCPSSGMTAKCRVSGVQTAGRAELAAAVGAINFHLNLPRLNATPPLLIITDYYSLASRWTTMHNTNTASITKLVNRDLWLQLHNLRHPPPPTPPPYE
jgi:hypothetical protein